MNVSFLCFILGSVMQVNKQTRSLFFPVLELQGQRAEKQTKGNTP